MEKKCYIGIDPGISGAIAIIDNQREILLLADWPGNAVAAYRIILDVIFDVDSEAAAIESVHSMPGQGVSSTFKFGQNFGIWQGILATLGISTLLPTPHAWQKGVIHKGDGPDPKSRSMAAALRLFPKADIRLKTHHSRADALLIAWWLFRGERI